VDSGSGRVGTIAKRYLDVAAACTLLVVLLPLIAVVAILIKLDSPGPVFFRCARVGFRGRELRMLKFRKMHDGAAGPALTSADDPRFTRVGRWLARTKLDEVPQLWNVVTGTMSLVGPRPEDRSFVERHQEAYTEILQVKPGMTGLSQLAFAEETEILGVASVEHYERRLLPQKIALDRMYVRRRTLGLDLRVLLWTVVAVILRRRVAVNRASGELGLRRRPPEPRVAPDEIPVEAEA
jgi:lipopolysaccharide/colanic/teichoic acid biosynthesis glycosyltransferase